MNKIAIMLRSGAESWAHLLRAALPDHAVVVDPHESADAIYAVVGKPLPGVLAKLAQLQVVFSVNAGVEALLESAEVPPGIPIVRMVDDGLAAGMLEWVLATTLAWHRNLFAYRDRQQRREWAPRAELLACEVKVTVLGAGHLGGRAAQWLARLGFNVRSWSRSPKTIEGVSCLWGPQELQRATADCEILVNLLPLTPATENIVNKSLLANLAPQAVLINAGRGRHVVDDDVIEAVDRGQLRAAVLDVFRDEPLPGEHPFWGHPGVYVTPHVAAPTHAHTAVSAIADNVRRYERGEALLHVVELNRGY